MRTVTYRLEDLCKATIKLGFVGENEHTRIIIDSKFVFDQYPNALAALTVQPPEGEAYPAVVVREGNMVQWDIYDSDLVYDGRGEGQLAFSENGKAVRSFVFTTVIDRSIVPTGEVPEPLDNFLTRAGEALTAIPQTIQDTFGEISAEAETLPAGSSATAEFDSETMKVSFGIPTGEKGETGERGERGPAGSQGERGPAGETGPAGPAGKDGKDGKDAVVDDTLTQPGQAADAAKTGEAISQLNGAIDGKPETKTSDAEGVDLDITDASGNVILRLANGHIQSKMFDSSDISGGDAQIKASNAVGVDLDLTDEEGAVILRMNGGHLETKEFDSRDVTEIKSNETYARSNPLFTTINWWEPEEADSGYSNPTSGYGGDTRREDWTATDKYYYYDFLAHYYDLYLGLHADGYRVTKRSLGQDSANTGHELFEYDFCPVNYKYTVMLSAGMNADETQGIWGLATFMRSIMNKEETNMEIAYNNIRFKVIPIINASGFDKANLQYTYSDGVNPNFNFNYKDSWSQNEATTSQKGAYPDSNVSTVILKKWINDHSGKADLWIDLHTGRWESSYPNKKILDVRVADSSMVSPFATYITLCKNYYIEKGYITSTDSIGGTENIRTNMDYQKTVYAFDVCGIKSIMPEMHLESTGYGSDGLTNNSVNGIKCYTAQIRAMMMCYINESASNGAIRTDSIEYIKLHRQ